jgi:hypothetical protein
MEEVTIEQLGKNVVEEVLRARKMWGTEFDLKNTLNDWVSYINSYTAKASRMGAPKEEVVTNLRKAAGLALSALYHAENDLLAPRHYETQQRPTSLPDIE